MSTTGSAIAATNFARNAGAVDKKSAVGASASLNRAAGRLVATASGGDNKGQIPYKFLADVSNADSFAAPFQVQDNAAGVTTVLDSTSFGRFEASCQDEQSRAGTENPRTSIVFANTSGAAINFARRVGNGNGTVGVLANATQDAFNISASNTFEYHLQKDKTHILIQGAVRQDRPTTAEGNCLIWGSVQVVKDQD